MQYVYTKANDGCPLAFQSSIPLPLGPADTVPETLIILIHGFSGSSAYFQRNVEDLSSSPATDQQQQQRWVVAPDLRGHGNSGRCSGGYHVARLAADLHDLLRFLRSQAVVAAATGNKEDKGDQQHHGGMPPKRLKIVPVGCSIGAAVLWTYVELFGDAEFAGLVFVDQAPLQDRAPRFGGWDARLAHRGCYDEASMLGAQEAWIEQSEAAYRGLVADCLGYRVSPLGSDGVTEQRQREDEDFFVGESRKCDPVWLARLLADHTRYDHREAIEEIRVPVMVMAGRRTGCFPLDGMEETVRRAIKGRLDRGEDVQEGDHVRWVVFESGHWLFWEEPKRFNSEIGGFVNMCAQIA